MVVVVYCYVLLTVHQATYSVREGVILNQRSPYLIFTSTYLCRPSPIFMPYSISLFFCWISEKALACGLAVANAGLWPECCPFGSM